MKDFETIDTYIMSDQPTCCPKCSLRTIFNEIINPNTNEIIQLHKCNTCNYEFILQQN